MKKGLLLLVGDRLGQLIVRAGDRIERDETSDSLFEISRDLVKLARISIHVESRRRIAVHGELCRVAALGCQKSAQISVDLA